MLMGNDIKTREKSFSIMRILKGIVGLIIPSSFFEKKATYEDKVAVAYYRVYLAQTVSKLIAGDSYKPNENNGITQEGRKVANAMIRSDKYFSEAVPSVLHIGKHVGHSIASGGITAGVGAVGVAYNAKNVVIPPIKYVNELRSGTLADHVGDAQNLVKNFEEENAKLAKLRAIPTNDENARKAKFRAIPTNTVNKEGIQDYVKCELSDKNMMNAFQKAGISVSDDEKKLVITVDGDRIGIDHEKAAKISTAQKTSEQSPKLFDNYTTGNKVSSSEFTPEVVAPGFRVDSGKDNTLKQDKINHGPEQEKTNSAPRPGGPGMGG